MASRKPNTSFGALTTGSGLGKPQEFDWHEYRRRRRQQHAERAHVNPEDYGLDAGGSRGYPRGDSGGRRVSPARASPKRRSRGPRADASASAATNGRGRTAASVDVSIASTAAATHDGAAVGGMEMHGAPPESDAVMGAQQSLALRRAKERRAAEASARKEAEHQRKAEAVARQRELDRVREIARQAASGADAGGGAAPSASGGGDVPPFYSPPRNANPLHRQAVQGAHRQPVPPPLAVDSPAGEPQRNTYVDSPGYGGGGAGSMAYQGGAGGGAGQLQHPAQPSVHGAAQAGRSQHKRLPPIDGGRLTSPQPQQQAQQQSQQPQHSAPMMLHARSQQAGPQLPTYQQHAGQQQQAQQFPGAYPSPTAVQAGGVLFNSVPQPRMPRQLGAMPPNAPPPGQQDVNPSVQLYRFLGTVYDAHDPVDLDSLFQCVFKFAQVHQETLNLDMRHGEFQQTLLHRVCARGYSDLTALLLLMGADVNVINRKGITPLMDAAASGYAETCEVLLKYGADVDMQDSRGYTAMRMAVKNKHEEVARLLLNRGADLTLGSAEDQVTSNAPVLDMLVERLPEIAMEALDKRRKPLYRTRGYIGETLTRRQWEEQVESAAAKLERGGHGSVRKRGHTRRLSHLSEVANLGFLDAKKSAQGIMTEYDYSNTEKEGVATTLRKMVEQEHLELLVHPWTTHLLDHKWSTFASGIFFRGFITYCIYLASFCISTALYIKGHDKLPGDSDATGYDHVRFVFDMITLLLTAYATYTELAEVCEVGHKEYCSNGWNLFDVTQIVLVWLAVWLRVGQAGDGEKAVIAILGPVMWVKILNFARTLSFIGPTVHMVSKMVLDIFRFLSIFVLILCGFAQAMYTLGIEGYESYDHAMLHGFTVNLGDFDTGVLENQDNTGHVIVSVFVFVVYNILSPILLVNLLIAIMSDTYAKYSESRTGAWRMQQALFILAEQSRLDNKKYHEKFAVGHLWVIDSDRPVHGLAHFNDNPVAWCRAADTDDPDTAFEHPMLTVPNDEGQMVATPFPRQVASSTINLAQEPVQVRQALLNDILKSKGLMD